MSDTPPAVVPYDDTRRPQVRALTASAVRRQITTAGKVPDDARVNRKDWQDEAWGYFRSVGEVAFAMMFLGDAISKLRLFVAARPDPEAPPVPADDPESRVDPTAAKIAIEALARLKGDQGGQSQILKETEVNLEVAGEMTLYGRPAAEAVVDPSTGKVTEPARPEETWEVLSVSELHTDAGGRSVILSDVGDRKGRPIAEGDITIRMWTRDPEFSGRAFCHLRPLLDECETLQILSRDLRATGRSRLAGNGILLMPSELSFGSTDPSAPANADPFFDDLMATMMAPIQDEGNAAAVVPLVVRGPADVLEKVRHITLARPNDAATDEKIERRLIRIANGLNLPLEIVLSHRSCVDTETEIFTARGWLRHDQVQAGDETLTLNHVSGLAEWQPIERVSRYPVTDEPMLSLRGRNHSSLSTMDHRWPVLSGRGKRRWIASADLKEHHRIVVGAPTVNLPTEPKWSDAFVEIVGWFWTEGTWVPSGSGVIYQSHVANPSKVDRIRSALTVLYGPAVESMHRASKRKAICMFENCGWPAHGHGLCDAHRGQQAQGIPLRPVRRYRPKPAFAVPTEVWRESRHDRMTHFHLSKLATDRLREVMDGDKVVTFDFLRSLTASQIELFVNVSVDGDGYRYTNGTTLTLSQSERRRVEAWEFAAILSGRSVATYIHDDGGIGAFPNGVSRQNTGAVWQTRASPPRPVRLLNLTRDIQPYSGEVWCPTTANGSWLARRDGLVHFTGNTTFSNAFQIDANTFDDHVQPRAVTIVDLLTNGYLRPTITTPVTEGGPPLVDVTEAEKMFVWFDATELLARPNQAEEAEKAHAEGVIGDEAHRRYLGIPETDAPTDEDLLRALLRRGLVDATMTAEILAALGVTGVSVPERVPAAAPSMTGEPGPFTEATVEPEALDPDVVDRAAELGITAAATTTNTGERVGRRLMQIDRTLRTRLEVAADRAMTRALERAGAKLRAKVGRSGDLAVTVDGIPNAHVAATLGQLVVSGLGFASDDLLNGAFDDLADDCDEWISGAQANAAGLIGRFSGATPTSLDALAARQTQGRERAREVLIAGLLLLAGKRLFDPSPAAPPLGETDASLSVPTGVLRDVLSVAGGQTPDGEDGPLWGVATGPDVMGVLSESGGGVEGYEWDYGPADRRPFPPHEALDGTVVENVDDPAWANEEGWPSDQNFPGDHDGCVLRGTVVAGPGVVAGFHRWYVGLVVEVVVAGARLSLTVNHPVLTARGWVPAGDLLPGDMVVSTDNMANLASLVDPTEALAPTRIERVFRSPDWTGGWERDTQRADFHGDGDGSDQHAVQVNMRLARRAGRTFENEAEAAVMTASDLHDTAPYAAQLEEAAGALLHGSTSGPVGVFASAARMTAVRSVRTREFAGSVYNLDTGVGWYAAAGIIVANCVCDISPTLIAPSQEQSGD